MHSKNSYESYYQMKPLYSFVIVYLLLLGYTSWTDNKRSSRELLQKPECYGRHVCIMSYIIGLQLSLIITSTHCRSSKDRVSHSIRGDRYVATIENIPYHVLVVLNNLYCSGCLIRSNIVVTVASCLATGNTTNAVVKVGCNTITDSGEIIPVLEVKIHEYFRHLSFMDNDIALLILQKHVRFGKKVKKAIVDPEISIAPGTIIDVSGWGSNNLNAEYIYKLLLTKMTVMETYECESHYRKLITRSNFCANFTMGRRLSDNGGPAIFRDMLVGIMSYGATSDTSPHIALLTNISYFNRWINKNSYSLLSKYCVNKRLPEKHVVGANDYVI